MSAYESKYMVPESYTKWCTTESFTRLEIINDVSDFLSGELLALDDHDVFILICFFDSFNIFSFFLFEAEIKKRGVSE